MSGTVKLSAGELIGLSSQVARGNVLALLAFVVPLTLIGAGLDRVPAGGSLAANIGTLIAGYFLYEHMLRKEGLMAARHSGRAFGSYIGVAMLSGIAIMVGLVLLIVPGLILMARWSIASPIVVAEGSSTPQALGASWAATRASQWTIVLTYVIFGICIFLPGILLGVGIGFAAVLDTELGWGTSLATNLFAQLLGAGGYVISVAIMQGVYRGIDDLEEVFA